MIHFTRLRLSGFKSFVDPVEVAIDPGMTGVVGPNGCGKSNLVEALRWVMGETSAKQMRGSEMDDVIFGGSSGRPARNLAEVSLMLDNREHSAPAQFNDADQIEITRRIDRGQGSSYKVSGRETRARDVQVLFADAATGARSTAIVSQGRIGALINAKPSERRSLLEEAAGIGGLHSRRHEAELRLKSAEGNLERLEDVLTTHDSQLQSLKRQARQAARYRALSQQIRETEARLLSAQWNAVMHDLDAARTGLQESERQVAQLTGLAAEAATRQAAAAAILPDLRMAEAEAAAKMQRFTLAREQIDAEEGRQAAAKRDMETRLQQIDADLGREAARAKDADGALARLTDERALLLSERSGEEDAEGEAEAVLETAAAEMATREAALAALMEELAAKDADRAAAIRAQTDAENRRDRLSRRLEEIVQQRAAAEAELVDQTELTSSEMDLEEALEYLEASKEKAEGAQARREAAQTTRDQARDALQSLAMARTRLVAEADALKGLLAEAAGGAFRPVLDEIIAMSGYEVALGAALGDDLSAPLDAQAPIHWQERTNSPEGASLPAGAQPLSHFVTAPAALARRLQQIGVVADAVTGEAMKSRLATGQRLVSPEGDLWRWDGLEARAGAPNAAAVRLRQRNRLRELDMQIEDADLGVEEAEERAEAASQAVERETLQEARARDDVKRAEAESAKLREIWSKLSQRASAAQSRLDALLAQEQASADDLTEAKASEEAARQEVLRHAGNDDGRDRVALLRAELAEQRTALVEARSQLDRLRREAGERSRRLAALADEEASWLQRAATAKRQADELTERRAMAWEELERLAALPLEIAERRARLDEEIHGAGEERRQAAARLTHGEQALTAADRAMRDAEQALATAREERVRREALVGGAAQTAKSVAERIAEKLDLTPSQLTEQTGEVPPAECAELEQKLARANREREAMGPVNLMAEDEARELEERLEEMRRERDDLVAAIAKLRQAIADINRQGRERLRASFEEVDQHFRSIFVRLFGGGRAHLTLTESNDPLEAGLEIMASPPGKRLQVLSLLSGGEQALTALALLFAVFMTNPAPICILDEVDAPLDDANVDRFCKMVAEIANTTRTRFLVVTHHRMTMARMDRLYGVTMAERGVSTVLSVDLHMAEELAEQP